MKSFLEKLLQKYMDNILMIDFIICVIITFSLSYLFNRSDSCEFDISQICNVPDKESMTDFQNILISVSVTFLGFLLTIITIIVTFKNGFEERKVNNPGEANEEASVFNTTISKNIQFYGTDLYKKVIRVFRFTIYEITGIVLILLGLVSNILIIKQFLILEFTICLLIILCISIVRSIYIFHLFLNVHKD